MKIKLPEIKYSTIIKTALITMVVMTILLYLPSPFVVVKPGLAVSTGTFIQNKQLNYSGIGQADKQGQFILTAVLMESPNIWTSLLSIFNTNKTIMLKSTVMQGDSLEQYSQRATTMMQGSYDYALEAAYRYLNITYTNEPRALYVNESGTSMLSKSGDRLESGDQIVGIVNQDEQLKINSVTELGNYLIEHPDEKKITLEIRRMEKYKTITVSLRDGAYQEPMDKWVAGQLHVNSFTVLRKIEPVDKQYKIALNESIIGGPSAGLVLTLTIIDELTQGDLTQGHQVAATGTINEAGQVGMIGGIKQKVVSTSQEGVCLFVVPRANEDEARKKVKAMNSSMEIIGVDSLEEAIQVIASFTKG